MQYVFWVQDAAGTKEKIHEQETDVMFERREIVTIDGARHAIQMLERRMESGKEIASDPAVDPLGAAAMPGLRVMV
ncbi:MAG: hypothetical protein IIC73_08725 [Armatimonadetes bacterium]|nr:hypothetical protein [Armatimonadota bacterium]